MWGRSSPARRHGRDGEGGVDCERSAGNYGRRPFRSNQREIWRGLGRGLIGAGTQLCIHLSMRGLHRQSLPSWLNQSPISLLPPLPTLFCIPGYRVSYRRRTATTATESKRAACVYIGVCIWVCTVNGTVNVYMEVRYNPLTILTDLCTFMWENVKSAAKHRMFLKRIEQLTIKILFENELI